MTPPRTTAILIGQLHPTPLHQKAHFIIYLIGNIFWDVSVIDLGPSVERKQKHILKTASKMNNIRVKKI